MISDNLWIAEIDHRISVALILFFLLILLGNSRKRGHFFARAGASLAVLCTASWFMRFAVETCLPGMMLRGMGYSIYQPVMFLLYMGCYGFCYRSPMGERVYSTLLAMVIYKVAWNVFKAMGYGMGLAGVASVWSRYSVAGSLVSYVVYATVCVICSMQIDGNVKKCVADLPRHTVTRFAVAFMACQISLEYCGHVFTADTQAQFLYYFCAMMYSIINLLVLRLVAERGSYLRDQKQMQDFIDSKMRYYQMSRDGIASLQVKCHDLKHQIAAIRSSVGKANLETYIDRLEDSMIEYGTVVECGNEAINLVLTEKNILCSTSGVRFSYMLDGKLFDFMSEMEIYSLFGNALDNALEGCVKVTDPQRRVIALKAMARGDMVVLHVENYFEEPLNMVDGMPVTTKDGPGHGYGLRSIWNIAEKYHGIAAIQVENHIFKLNVVMNPKRE